VLSAVTLKFKLKAVTLFESGQNKRKKETYSEDRALVIVNVFFPLSLLLLFVLSQITAFLVLSGVLREFLLC